MTNILFFRSVQREDYSDSPSDSSESYTVILDDDQINKGQLVKQEEDIDGVVVELKQANLKNSFSTSRGFALSCYSPATHKPIEKINLLNNQSKSRRKRESSTLPHRFIKGQGRRIRLDARDRIHIDEKVFPDTEEEFNFWNPDPRQIDPCFYYPVTRYSKEGYEYYEFSVQRRLWPLNSYPKARA